VIGVPEKKATFRSVTVYDEKLSSQRKLPAQIEQAKDKFYDVLPLLCKQTSDVFLRKFSLAYVRSSALTPGDKITQQNYLHYR
jgi:hypothetical protein